MTSKPRMPHRHLAASCVWLASGLSLLLMCGMAHATDMATVEQRIIADVMATLPLDSTVQTRMNTLGTNGLWSTLTYNLTSTTDTHLQYMRDIARAYNSPASSHYQSTTARDKYLLAFDGWVREDPNHDNWWWRAIGYPRTLGEGMLLMKSQLSSAQKTSGINLLAYAYLPRSNTGLTNTGVNRTDRAYANMMRAILSNNGSLLTESFLSIGDTILFTTLEGMQPDGSYHQHTSQLYSGGYGKRFAEDIPKYGSYGVGTIYNYGPRQIREYTDYTLDGLQWFFRGPIIDYVTLGRSIVIKGDQSSTPFIPSAQRTLTLSEAYRTNELAALQARLEDGRDTGAAAPSLAISGNRMLWRSDYMVHHRPGFMASVKTASTRTVECEVINEQGKKSLHMSDGMTMFHRRGDEYTNLMPVWDWQRLPGTTIEQASYSLRPVTNPPPDWLYGTSTHAGGVSDGNDGAMAYIYSKRNVSARKSWFFVGDAILALGAGINAPAAVSNVLTTLNQSYLKTTISYSTGGSAKTLTNGTVAPSGLQWVHHDETGYFFPGGNNAATIRAQEQTGRLYDINGYGTSTTYMVVQTQNVFSVDINHGKAFTGGTYAYVVVPGLAAGAMDSFPLSDLTVLSNTSNIQAVKHVSNGLTMANFFAAGTVGGITVSHSCSIMVRDTGNTIEVTVSDPKQVIAGDLTVQIARPTVGLIEADGEVTVDQYSPTITMRVNMAGSTGRRFSAKFYTAPTAYPKIVISPVADSDVLDGSGNANYGTATNLQTKLDSSSGDWREAYLKFDLSGISGTPVAARLVLSPTSISTTSTLHVVAPVANHAWTEGGITWNNRPQPAGPAREPWLPRLGQPVRADVLGTVQHFKGAGGEVSLWVAPFMQSDAVVSFASKEHATPEWRPTLELTFKAPYSVDNSIGATLSLGEAVLNGWLIDGPADVTIYWGESDGGTNGPWDHAIVLTNLAGGTFAPAISNLITGTTYHYRAYATGVLGAVWATNTASFISPSPAILTFDANGGTAADPGSKQVVFGTTYGGLATTTRTGYGFVGWFTAPEGGELVTSASTVTIAGDHTLYAQWNAHPVVNAGLDKTVILSGGVPWTPAEIASVSVAWYDAADAATVQTNGGAVTNWQDKSGNNRHAAQTNPANRPTYLVNDPMVNNLPSIGNIATNGAIGLNTPSMSTRNIYVVTYYKDGVDSSFDVYSTLLSGPGLYGTYRIMGNTVAPGTDFISSYGFNDAGTYKNGSSVNTNLALPMVSSVFKFKSSATRSQVFSLGFNALYTDRDWQGRYSEWIFTDGTEDFATEQKIEGYLAHKWGLTASLPEAHPYKYIVPQATGVSVQLEGFATDAENDPVTTLWTRQGGPSGVTFANASVTNTTTTFTEDGVYTLRLTADDGYGQSYDDVIITVTTEGALPAPTGLTARAVSGTQIDLVWADIGTNETGFLIQRSTTSGSGFSLLASVGVNVTNYTDNLVSAGPTYFYRVAATNSETSSPFSPEASVTTPNLPTVVNAGPDHTISFNSQIPWTPSEIATVAWYDAADTNTITITSGKVSLWRDKSVNTNHLGQGTLDNRPMIEGTINGISTIGFDGTNDVLFSTGAISIEDQYVSFVGQIKTSVTVANKRPINMQYGSTNYFAINTRTNGSSIKWQSNVDATSGGGETSYNPFMMGTSIQTNKFEGHFNGVLTASVKNLAPLTAVTNFSVGGAAPTAYAGMYAAEVIVHGVGNKQKVEGYLAHKWGLAGNLHGDHMYKTNAPEIPVATVTLAGAASDPDGAPVTFLWTLEAGPAPVTFANATNVSTTAGFTTNGVYTLRLTVFDGFNESYDEVMITVNESARTAAYEAWLVDHYGDAGIDDTVLSSNGINSVREAYIAGLNPTNSADRFVIENIGATGSDNVLHWSGSTGRLYSVYWSSNLLHGVGFELIGSNIPWNLTSFTDTVHRVSVQSFYRIGVQLEED